MELLLEAHSGIAGDMTLAALLELGVTPAALEAELRKLALAEAWTLEVTRVTRHGIVANHVRFLVNGKPVEGPYLASDKGAGHGHDHDHDHDHGHPHDHSHPHEHGPRGPGGPHAHDSDEQGHGRTYGAIRKLIDESGMAAGAKARAQKIFRVIGEAEAKLHGIALDAVHFHEVGSLDAILDICGVAAALEILKVERIWALPLPVGGGAVRMAHGMLPVPAPATLEILKGFPVRRVPWRFETVTPTGAAIVAALASAEAPAAYRIDAIGYGAGSKDPLEVANLLRVFAVRAEAQTGLETIMVLETTVDDSTPEQVAHVLDKLRAQGALDAFAVPAFMKKGRSGVHLTVLAAPGDADRLSDLIFRESTTIGIRRRAETRRALPRTAGTVKTPWGEVAVKTVELPGGLRRSTPEYESCAALAAQTGVPLIDIYRAAAGAG